jgi:hypothetical protein
LPSDAAIVLLRRTEGNIVRAGSEHPFV